MHCYEVELPASDPECVQVSCNSLLIVLIGGHGYTRLLLENAFRAAAHAVNSWGALLCQASAGSVSGGHNASQEPGVSADAVVLMSRSAAALYLVVVLWY